MLKYPEIRTAQGRVYSPGAEAGGEVSTRVCTCCISSGPPRAAASQRTSCRPTANGVVLCTGGRAGQDRVRPGSRSKAVAGSHA